MINTSAALAQPNEEVKEITSLPQAKQLSLAERIALVDPQVFKSGTWKALSAERILIHIDFSKFICTIAGQDFTMDELRSLNIDHGK